MQARLERLINLVIALRETRRPLLAAEVRRRVAGYGQSDPEAFRRMFERDKADLREMGVPVETVAIDRFGRSADRLGYRIDPRRYDLPELDLEPAELAALALAVQMTGLADEASSGLLKLAVDAGDPDIPTVGGQVSIEVPLDAPCRGELMEAQLARQVVRFVYAIPGTPPALRTVDPHALVHRRGRWYLVGRDHDRDAQRVFRLDRILGSCRTVGEPRAFDAPEEAIGPDDVVPPVPEGSPVLARVAASPEVAWEVARSARGSGAETTQGGRTEGWTAFTVAVRDPEQFAGWVSTFGSELTVLEPPELRAAMIARLEATIRAARAAAEPSPVDGDAEGTIRATAEPSPVGGDAGVRAIRQPRTLARLERILVMVPWLLEHPGVELAEAARRFGVGVGELADDLDVLGYCGVPGYGGGDLVEVSLFGDRVTVRMADFFARPLSLSLREALTLMLAGRALDGLWSSAELRSAVAKLQRLLGANEAPSVAIELLGPGDEHLPMLTDASEKELVVHLTYRSGSKAQTTERDVEPWALTGLSGAWYVQGWCRLAGAPRTFRVDRIREVRLTGEIAPSDRPRRIPSPVYQPKPEDLTVILDLKRPAWWVTDWVVCEEIEERGPIRRITMRTGQLEWIARLILRLGEHAKVRAPLALIERVVELAGEILQRYRLT
ncbi:MAG: helix-turn-helix transcriptional regulator [Egibacteraceae bacterium]